MDHGYLRLASDAHFNGQQAQDASEAVGLLEKYENEFVVQMHVVQDQGTSGYLFSLTLPTGERVMSVYSSHDRQQVHVYFRLASAPHEARALGFPVNLADGRRHVVILSVGPAGLTLVVDEQHAFGPIPLSSPLAACPTAGPECVFTLGALFVESSARGNRYQHFFRGTVLFAVLVPGKAIADAFWPRLDLLDERHRTNTQTHPLPALLADGRLEFSGSQLLDLQHFQPLGSSFELRLQYSLSSSATAGALVCKTNAEGSIMYACAMARDNTFQFIYRDMANVQRRVTFRDIATRPAQWPDVPPSLLTLTVVDREAVLRVDGQVWATQTLVTHVHDCGVRSLDCILTVGAVGSARYLQGWISLAEMYFTTAPTARAATQTSVSPVTESPTTYSTRSPTSKSPTTRSPTTRSPLSESPTTASPTTAWPTTASPTTASPTTVSPTTASPTTTTALPATQSPTTQSPATQSPTSSTRLPGEGSCWARCGSYDKLTPTDCLCDIFCNLLNDCCPDVVGACPDLDIIGL